MLFEFTETVTLEAGLYFPAPCFRFIHVYLNMFSMAPWMDLGCLTQTYYKDREQNTLRVKALKTAICVYYLYHYIKAPTTYLDSCMSKLL